MHGLWFGCISVLSEMYLIEQLSWENFTFILRSFWNLGDVLFVCLFVCLYIL